MTSSHQPPTPPNILFVTFVNPVVFSVATSLRVHHLLKMLSKIASVTCIAIIPKEMHGQGNRELIPKICSAYHEWELLPPKPVSSFIRLKPTEMSQFFSRTYVRQFREIIRERRIDMVWLDYIFFGDYFFALGRSRVPVVFGTHNVESSVYLDKSRLNADLRLKLKYFLKWMLIRRLERLLARRAKYFVSVSELDAAYYGNLRPGTLSTHLNSCISLDHYAHAPAETPEFTVRPVLLYTGLLKYEATYDAVLYFHREIMPLLDRLIPSYVFYIVGKDPVKAVRDLAGERVVVTGYVESTLPYFRGADIFVVPLRSGSGTRLKILEAMAAGIPIVTTSKGCEGLDVVDGTHLLVADTPEAFAHQIVRLLNDLPLRGSLVRNARELIVRSYDWRSLEQPMRTLLGRILESETGPS